MSETTPQTETIESLKAQLDAAQKAPHLKCPRGKVYVRPDAPGLSYGDGLIVRPDTCILEANTGTVLTVGASEIRKVQRNGKWEAMHTLPEVNAGDRIQWPATLTVPTLRTDNVEVKVFTFEQVYQCIRLQEEKET